jgi:hypothetical protein
MDTAIKHIERGYSADMSKEYMTDLAADLADKKSIDASSLAETIKDGGSDNVSLLSAAYKTAKGVK